MNDNLHKSVSIYSKRSLVNTSKLYGVRPTEYNSTDHYDTIHNSHSLSTRIAVMRDIERGVEYTSHVKTITRGTDLVTPTGTLYITCTAGTYRSHKAITLTHALCILGKR